MTIETFENLNTPTESKIANTTVKTFKDLTIDLNKLVAGATNNIERTHKIVFNALRFMHLQQVTVDQFIDLMNTVVKIPYLYQPSKLILFIEKFSFLIYDIELKSFKLRKANNTTISVKTVQDANKQFYTTIKSAVAKNLIDLTFEFNQVTNDITKVEKLIDKVSKQKATHDLEILKLRKANLVAYKKQLDSLNNSRSLSKVA
jgi:hypothetical protein